MNPNQGNYFREPGAFTQRTITPSPLDALKGPSLIRPVSTRLLASQTRSDGTLDEIYHEIPGRNGHKGAIFYIIETPGSGSRAEPQVSQRIFYTMVPDSNSQQFIAGIVESFNATPSTLFERIFTSSFGGEILIQNSRDSA